MQMFKVKILKGEYKGLEGYTLVERPNEAGCVLVYSSRSCYPYRVVKPIEDIMFIEEETGGV